MTKRKANREGTISKLPSGNYRMRTVDDIDGIAMRKSFTASSPTACRKAHSEWLQSESKVAIEKVKTVAQWAVHWLEVYCKGRVSYSTYRDYKMYVDKHIVPEIGGICLNDVRPAHIAKLFGGAKNRKGEPLSRQALGNIRICLAGIFTTAIDNRLCTSNPVANIKLPERTEQHVAVFKKEQVEHVIKHLNSHEIGPVIALLLYTGIRVGELLALTWTDVDAENQTIHIHRTLTKSENGEVVKNATKTKRERLIAYDEALEPYLNRIQKTGFYLLMHPRGTHHTHRTFERLYKQFFTSLNTVLVEDKLAPVPCLSAHKCRHTFATYMLRSGADLRVIQTLLGHSTIKTTEVYTEVDVEDLKANVSKLSY